MKKSMKQSQLVLDIRSYKTYPKSKLSQCVKVGTWIKVHWNDAEPGWGLVVDKPNWKERGSVILKCWFPGSSIYDINSSVEHTQIMMVGKTLTDYEAHPVDASLSRVVLKDLVFPK
jgi:hypothetical protein